MMAVTGQEVDSMVEGTGQEILWWKEQDKRFYGGSSRTTDYMMRGTGQEII